MVKKGDKITFSLASDSSPTNSGISIIATVSSPVLSEINYRVPVTKYLGSDITSDTADIADLKFTGLKIGHNYKVTLFNRATIDSGTNVQDNIGIRSLNGGSIVCASWVSLFRSSSSPSGSSNSSCAFTATSNTLIIAATSLGTGARIIGVSGVSDTPTNVTLEQIDVPTLTPIAESNIVQDVEQFPTTEQKLCDACYKGKALYKKCTHNVTTNNATLATNVTELKGTSGHAVISEGYVELPFYGSATFRVFVDKSGSTLRFRVGGYSVTSSDVCVEYTKD